MKNKKVLFDETIGWIGTILILSAYFLISLGKIGIESNFYKIMNLAGSLGIVYLSIKRKVYQPLIINVFWIIITLLAIYKK